MKATLFSANLKTPRAISLESLAELIKDSSKAKHIIALQDELCYTMPGIIINSSKRQWKNNSFFNISVYRNPERKVNYFLLLKY